MAKKNKQDTDPAILRAAEVFDEKGITLERLGLLMGFPPNSARRAAWQLLHKIADPKLSTMRKLAKALEIDIKELV
jgi:transcriptional regulator with XRE-family HTH domain